MNSSPVKIIGHRLDWGCGMTINYTEILYFKWGNVWEKNLKIMCLNRRCLEKGCGMGNNRAVDPILEVYSTASTVTRTNQIKYGGSDGWTGHMGENIFQFLIL